LDPTTSTELIGIPTIVIVGKGLANGVIEVRDRWAGTSSEISLEGAETQLLKMVGK
jgi:prolyl-tRNA synthetase